MAENAKSALALQKNVCDEVIARVNKLEQDKMLVLPKDYAVENHLKAAWLILQETQDKNHKPVLESCSKPSIANCLLDMTLQGLSASKKQCYFVAYGNKLTLMRSYFGTVALAKRSGGMKGNPIANVVYENDEFVYDIDPTTGLTRIIKHTQKMENIDLKKIVGAYCIIHLTDGTTQVTIMSMQQIRNAWAQGQGGGTSKAHTNFTDEMCKKTVIGRACKMLINSSDDAWLYEGKKDEMDAPADERENLVEQAEQEETLDEPSDIVDVEDISNQPSAPQEAQTETPTAAESNGNADLFNGNDPY